MSPVALFVSGAPASGKTTVGRAAAERMRAALLDLDVVTGPLTVLLGEVSGAGAALDHPWMREHAREARYESLLGTALDTLRAGTPTVLVAPFTTERADPRAWAATADRVRSAAAEPVLAWVDCPPGLLLSRMRERAAERDAGTLADPAKLLDTQSTPPATPHVRVDATRPIAEQLVELDLYCPSGRNQACLEAP